MPPHTYPSSVDDRWRDGRRQDYDAYNFGQANWRERRDGDQLRQNGERSGPRPGDGYRPRLADDFEAAADGWNMPPRASGYSPEPVGRGYGRDSAGDFRRAAEDGQWPAGGAPWQSDGRAQWSGDDRAQWSGRAPWSADGPAPGFGNDIGPSGPRSAREHIPAPEGRYAPLPDARRPELSRPEALPELPQPEPALPELPQPEPTLRALPQPEPSRPGPASSESSRSGVPLPAGPQPAVRRPEQAWPELPRPESASQESPRPEPSRSEFSLPDLPRPEPALQDLPRSASALPELPQPAVPRSGSGPGQLAGFRDDPSRPLDRPMPGSESGRPGPAAPRPDAVPPSAALSDRPKAGLGRSAEGTAELVPGQNVAAGNSANLEAGRDDDTVTTPMPAILPGVIAVPRPDPAEAPRGFFEPARSGSSPVRPVSVTGTVEPPPVDYAEPVPPRPMSPEATAKLDQLKDLYLTAEAIGEDALDKHFNQVSGRQRELIKEFFKRTDSGSSGAG